MGADPYTGRMHALTEEFVAQRPESRSWATFREGEVVSLKGQDFTVDRIDKYGLRLRTLPNPQVRHDPDVEDADALLTIINVARDEAKSHKVECDCRLCTAFDSPAVRKALGEREG